VHLVTKFTFLKSTQKDEFFDAHMSPVHEKNFPRVYSDLLVSVQPFVAFPQETAQNFEKCKK
jgi:hypothetical protein